MALSIKPISINDLRRAKNYPPYNFVETAIPRSTAYTIDDSGYFIVAPDDCLLPRFVVELQPPKLGSFEEYKELSFQLVEKSCGFLWYDTDDFGAFDFVWRLRLPLIPSAPLFAWNKQADVTRFKKAGLTYKTASTEDLPVAKEILTSLPVWQGGQTEAAVEENFQGSSIVLIEKDGQSLGAASLVSLPENCMAVDPLVIHPNFRGRGYGLAFAAEIGSKLAEQGITLVCSMRNDNETSFRSVNALGMKLLKQSYTAEINFTN